MDAHLRRRVQHRRDLQCATRLTERQQAGRPALPRRRNGQSFRATSRSRGCAPTIADAPADCHEDFLDRDGLRVLRARWWPACAYKEAAGAVTSRCWWPRSTSRPPACRAASTWGVSFDNARRLAHHRLKPYERVARWAKPLRWPSSGCSTRDGQVRQSQRVLADRCASDRARQRGSRWATCVAPHH